VFEEVKNYVQAETEICGSLQLLLEVEGVAVGKTKKVKPSKFKEEAKSENRTVTVDRIAQNKSRQPLLESQVHQLRNSFFKIKKPSHSRDEKDRTCA